MLLSFLVYITYGNNIKKYGFALTHLIIVKASANNKKEEKLIMSKKFAFLLAAIFIITSMLFTSCGTSANGNGQSAGSTVSNSTGTQQAASETTAAPAEKVTVKFANPWWLEPGRKELFEGFNKKFNEKYPQYTIEPVAISYSEYSDKMKVMLSSDAPDLFYVQQTQMKLWQEMGYLEPLNDYLDIAQLLKDVSVPEAQKKTEFDGKMYALYAEACPYSGLIYNKKMFEEAGVKVPTTPDELLAAAKKLTKGTSQYGFITANTPDNPAHIMQHGMITIHGFGGKIVLDNGEFGVNAPEFIEGLKFYKALNDSGAVPKAMNYTTQRKLFFAGKAAMCQDGGYFVTWTQSENAEVGKNIDVAYLPYPKKDNPIDLTYFSISSKSSAEVKKAAVAYLNFYMTPETQTEWIKSCGYPVTMKSAITPEYRQQYPWFKIYEDTAGYGIPLSVTGHETQSDEIRKVIADYICKVLQMNEPVEKAMNDCKAELDSMVK